MNSIDVLRSKQINIELTLEGIEFNLNGETTLINFEAISVTEALLLRLAFGQNQVGTVVPGRDTSQMFEELDKQPAPEPIIKRPPL